MSVDKAHLALYLDAPLQSWGHQSRFDRRTTLGYPTRSGVMGMLCAAMGVDQADAAGLCRLADLEMTVLVFEQGSRLWDYHTVGAGYDRETQPLFIVQTADGKPRLPAVLTNREYLQHSKFGVILTGLRPLLKGIEAATLNPKWGVWLGRKACIPASRVCEGIFGSENEAEAALIRAAGGRPVGRRIREVRGFAEGTDTLMDRPLNFKKRSFAPRRVKVE